MRDWRPPPPGADKKKIYKMPTDNIDALASAWLARAEALYGPGSDCLLGLSIDIEDWRSLRHAVAALAGGAGVSSYSIAGRSVTRADYGALRRQLADLEDRVRGLLGLGGGVLVADMRGGC